jgi:hypothetical protein
MLSAWSSWDGLQGGAGMLTSVHSVVVIVLCCVVSLCHVYLNACLPPATSVKETESLSIFLGHRKLVLL